MIVASLSYEYQKTGENKSTSLMPTIPVVPVVIIFIVFLLEKIGITSSIKIAFLIHGLILLLCGLVLAFAKLKTKNT